MLGSLLGSVFASNRILRCYRLFGLTFLGRGHDQLKSCREVRRTFSCMLESGRLSHHRVTVRRRCRPAHGVSQAPAPGIVGEALACEAQVVSDLFEREEHWVVSGSDPSRPEIRTVDSLLSHPAYQAQRCGDGFAPDSPFATEDGPLWRGVIGSTHATDYVGLYRRLMRDVGGPFVLVHSVQPSRVRPGSRTRYRLSVELPQVLRRALAHACRRAGCTLAPFCVPGTRSFQPSEQVFMTTIPGVSPPLRPSPWSCRPLAVLSTTSAREPWPFAWHPDKSRGAHALLVGPSGSGKTTFVSHLAALTLARTRARILVIDHDGSGSGFLDRAGGERITSSRALEAPGSSRVMALDDSQVASPGQFGCVVRSLRARPDPSRPWLVWIDHSGSVVWRHSSLVPLRNALADPRNHGDVWVACTRQHATLAPIQDHFATRIVFPGESSGLGSLRLGDDESRFIRRARHHLEMPILVSQAGSSVGVSRRGLTLLDADLVPAPAA